MIIRTATTMTTFTPAQLAAQADIRLSRVDADEAGILRELSDDVLSALHVSYAIGGVKFGAGYRLLEKIRTELMRRSTRETVTT